MYLQNFEKQKSIICVHKGGKNPSCTIFPSEDDEEIKTLKPQLKEILSHSGTLELIPYAPTIKIISTDFSIDFQGNKTVIFRKINNTNHWIQYSRDPIDQDIITAKYLEEIYHNKKERIRKNSEPATIPSK